MSASPTHTNALIHETSPYLLQHAHNPVDWHPWNTVALTRARREDRPILLSIGYSACHWCHVMEHESFEDEDVARVMNELFVCIKVDREERPDLDRIYQLAHQMLAQRAGGWPLNMFLTPDDHTPFFGGTYFPKEPRHGLPAFVDVLRRIAAFYHEHRSAIDEQNASVRQAFANIQARGGSGVRIEPALLDRAVEQLLGQFDPRYGGFGQAPKFPHPTGIERCLRHWAASAAAGRTDDKALAVARYTLHAMASGGIYDQLGGGFCRYSVDERWEIPHFEKMLYDNAQLLPLYTDASLATGDAAFRRAAIETADWVMREMQSPDGGYYSTLDADSEGHEGKFYVWTPAEVEAVLDADEYRVFAPRFGLDRPPNFENHAWNLHVYQDGDAIAKQTGLAPARIEALLASARVKLFAQRARRVRPGRDEKILTAWNGLMIKGMAHAGRLLGRSELIDSAFRALDFVRTRLWRDGRLLAAHKDGNSHLNGYLDDYVFVLDGVLALMQARWRDSDLAFATALADALLEHFEDEQNGAFFFTSDDHEVLIHRPKPASDDAIPSGNGVAAQALLRLGHLLGETRYLNAAERTLLALHGEMQHYPSAYNSLLTAAEEYLHPTETIVLRGEAAALAPWRARCQRSYAPRRLVVAIPPAAGGLPGVLAERAPKAEVTAYVCTGHACAQPATTLAELDTLLAASEPGAAGERRDDTEGR